MLGSLDVRSVVEEDDEVTSDTRSTMARSSYVLLLVTLLLAGLFASSFALPPQTGIHGGCVRPFDLTR